MDYKDIKELEPLLKGFETFYQDNFKGKKAKKMQRMALSQEPQALVIACCDSRVSPEILLDASLGELFVARHIAALVPPYDPNNTGDTVAASIDYAINFLKVEHIIVMGHTSCGGIEGLCSEDPIEGPVGAWLDKAAEVLDRVKKKNGHLEGEELKKAVEQESVVWSLKNLRGYPCVKKAMNEGKLRLHGWQYDMPKGKMLGFDYAQYTFNCMSRKPRAHIMPQNDKRPLRMSSVERRCLNKKI